MRALFGWRLVLTAGLVALCGCQLFEKKSNDEAVVQAPPEPEPEPVHMFPESAVPAPEPQPPRTSSTMTITTGNSASPAPTAYTPPPAPEPRVPARPVDSSVATTTTDRGNWQPAPKENYGKPKAERTYVVRQGDTLQKISRKYYGTTRKWRSIAQANRSTVKDPDKIIVGTKLVIP